MHRLGNGREQHKRNGEDKDSVMEVRGNCANPKVFEYFAQEYSGLVGPVDHMGDTVDFSIKTKKIFDMLYEGK